MLDRKSDIFNVAKFIPFGIKKMKNLKDIFQGKKSFDFDPDLFESN